jgi:hypothetical protein
MHFKTLSLKAVIGNPFYLFAIVLLFTFTLYILGWSNLFPPVKGSFIAFILLSLVLFITLGYIVKNRLVNMNLTLAARPSNSFLHIATALSLLVFVIEIILNGKIPIFDILFKTTLVDYREFYSIPIIHTLACTCGVFLVAVLFGLLSEKWNRRYMLLVVLNIMPYIILFSRSIIIIIIIQCFFYTALRVTALKIRHALFFVSFIILITYAFGVVGNYREKAKERVRGGSSFVTVSQLNSDYPRFLPHEFAWAYMYAASPIANFQHNVITSTPVTPDFKGLIVSEFLPSRAKLILSEHLNLKTRKTAIINSNFTAGTVFSGAYSYAGWLGVSLMLVIIIGVNFIVVYILSFNSSYSLISLSVLLSFTVLNFFENMISFTPMILLLFGSLGFHIYSIVKRRIKLK